MLNWSVPRAPNAAVSNDGSVGGTRTSRGERGTRKAEAGTVITGHSQSKRKGRRGEDEASRVMFRTKGRTGEWIFNVFVKGRRSEGEADGNP